MRIRTLILDDDQPTRERIRSLLAEQEDVDVVGEADEEAAVELINERKPDLVFLDLSNCGARDFDKLRALDPQRRPGIIVVTSDARCALAAFDMRALDCLLKPFEATRFNRALDRARDYLDAKADGRISRRQMRLLEDLEAAPQYLTRVTVKTADRVLFVKVDQIGWVEAEDNYVKIHVGKQTYILRETLGGLEAKLDPERFFRISRSALVNLDHVAELRPMFKGEYVVVLQDGSHLPTTRGVRELQKLLMFA